MKQVGELVLRLLLGLSDGDPFLTTALLVGDRVLLITEVIDDVPTSRVPLFNTAAHSTFCMTLVVTTSQSVLVFVSRALFGTRIRRPKRTHGTSPRRRRS